MPTQSELLSQILMGISFEKFVYPSLLSPSRPVSSHDSTISSTRYEPCVPSTRRDSPSCELCVRRSSRVPFAVSCNDLQKISFSIYWEDIILLWMYMFRLAWVCDNIPIIWDIIDRIRPKEDCQNIYQITLPLGTHDVQCPYIYGTKLSYTLKEHDTTWLHIFSDF